MSLPARRRLRNVKFQCKGEVAMRCVICVAAFVLGVFAATVANADIVGTYVDANNSNTGPSSALTTVDIGNDNLWCYPSGGSAHASWDVFGGRTVVEGYSVGETCPTIQTSITGLTPNYFYDLRVLFGNHTNWNHSIMAGLGSTSLTVYDGSNSTVAVAGSLYFDSGYMNLNQAILGTVQADSSGTISAYIAANPSGSKDGRCDYDGLSYQFKAAPEPGTSLLIATGILGLLCYAWKKRR
jgi:hypothetical protein